MHLLYLHLDFIARDKFNTYVPFTLSAHLLQPLFSFISFFFSTWAGRRPLAFTHTYTLYFPSPRSQLSILQCVALSSHTSPSLPFPHSCFLLSLPLSSCFTLALPALLLSAPSLLPLLLSLVLFINLLGCYSPCLALLMKAGCRWGRRSSL